MSLTVVGSEISSPLRKRAEARLKAGTAPPVGTWSTGVDALRLLHRLSSDPATAEDALKLLHELQVHQVEIDLQHEAIAANEQALVEELSLYQELYECAPFGCFVLDRGGVVIQANPAAAALFGLDRHHLTGRRIDSLLAPQNLPPLLALVQRVGETGTPDSCIAAVAGAKPPRPLLFLASSSGKRDHVLLACCEYPGEA